MKWWRARLRETHCCKGVRHPAPAPGYRSCDACRAASRAYHREGKRLRAELAARKAAGGTP